MTIRKLLARGLLPSLLALSLSGTCSGMIAFAEETSEGHGEYSYEGYTLTVALNSSDMQFTWDDDKICYPAVGYAPDCSLTLKMNDKTYEGEIRHSASPIPRINYGKYLADLKKSGAKEGTDLPTLASLGFFDVPDYVETRYVVFELDEKPTSGSLTINTGSISNYTGGLNSSDYTYEFYSSTMKPTTTWSFSASDLYDNAYLDLYDYYNPSSREDIKPDFNAEYGSTDETKDFILVTDITGGKSGLNSLQLIDVPVGHEGDAGSYYINRAKYGASDITDVTMTLSGSENSQSMHPYQGTVFFSTPTKWDAENSMYTCTSNWYLSLLGITAKKDTHGFTVEDFPIEVPSEPLSANKDCLNINTMHKEWFDELEDDGIDPSNKLDDEGSIRLDPMIDTADMYDATLTLNVDSKLSKYDTSLLSGMPEIRVRGAATQAYLDNNARSDSSIGDIVTWGTVDSLVSGKTSISVEAGSYTVDALDNISVKMSGKADVKSGKTKEVKLTVEPKYSLKVTSEAGVVNCSIQGITFNGDASLLFATDGNTAYTVKDNDSGKTYSVIMTDADPHKELVLGSAGAEDVGLVDDLEDVPNTADPITTVMIVVIALAVLFAGSFIVVYRANKKNERG